MTDFFSYAKSYYSPNKANEDYKSVLKDYHIDISLTIEKFNIIDSIISRSITEYGQSIAHIFIQAI